jgi:hypothetical protein
MKGVYDYMPETHHVSMVFSSCSVFTIYAKCTVTSHVKCFVQFIFVLLEVCVLCVHVCAVPNMATFVAPWFCAFLVCCSGIFWMILQSVPFGCIIAGITLFLCSTGAVFLLAGFFYFRFFCALLVTFLSLKLQHLLALCSFSIITDFIFQFTVRDGSVGLHLLIPWCVYLQNWFLLIRYLLILVFIVTHTHKCVTMTVRCGGEVINTQIKNIAV